MIWIGILVASFGKSGHYDPQLDGMAQVNQAVEMASEDGKHVLIQIGGEWCVWCHRMDEALEKHDGCLQEIRDHFVYIHLNYSDENKNRPTMQRLGFPQRFGFPVWVILDDKGTHIHTQELGPMLTKSGDSWRVDPEKALGILKQWNPAALDPETYK